MQSVAVASLMNVQCGQAFSPPTSGATAGVPVPDRPAARTAGRRDAHACQLLGRRSAVVAKAADAPLDDSASISSVCQPGEWKSFSQRAGVLLAWRALSPPAR
jgi:hypothetical protein